MEVLTSLQEAIAGAAERVGPSVVGLGRGWGLGSGVVIGAGQVLTNAHNLRRDQVTVAFADGRRETGEWTAADADLDLAVMSVDTGDAPAIAWEPGDAPGIGTPVLALANPGGRGLRATLGFVASEGRSFRGPRGRRIAGAIEHTAPLPRGSSGGPLVDVEGRLLGLNALRLDGGLILAVPATARGQGARPSGSPAARRRPAPRLGVAVAPPRVARRLRRAVGLPERAGLLVRAVEDGSPAAAAGIEAGDLLVGRRRHRARQRGRALRGCSTRSPDGGSLELTVVRGTEERTVTVRLRGDRSRGVSPVAEAPPPVDPAEAEALDAYSHAVIAVAERVGPSVASLRVMRRVRGGQVPSGAGSAVALTPDGYLLTNAHVVGRSVTGGRATFADGRETALRGRRPRPALRPRRPARRGRRARAGRRSATPSGCAWASSSWRSATRTGSAAR